MKVTQILSKWQPSEKIFVSYLLMAALSLLTALMIQYVGEEAVYSISSLEMWVDHVYSTPLLYGVPYSRPPLMNWVVIPLANLLGWEHMLWATRIETILATIGSTLICIWFVQKLFCDRNFALFVACVYLSGDIVFRKGWLAYADPTFAFFVFASMACLWVAVEEKRKGLLCLACLCVIGGFLSKAYTAYTFYGVMGLVLLLKHPNRRFLLSFASIIMHFIVISFPVLWSYGVTIGSHGTPMAHDLLAGFNFHDLTSYCLKLVTYPFKTFFKLLPVSGVALYALTKRKIRLEPEKKDILNIVVWVTVINYLPYWLAPSKQIRYILPLFPFFAVLIAASVWKNHTYLKLSTLLLVGGLGIRLIEGFWVLPYYQTHYRGSYLETAKSILAITREQPLYAGDSSFAGLSIVAELDHLRLPKHPLVGYSGAIRTGYLINREEDPALGDTVAKYHHGNKVIYLLRLKQTAG